MVVSDIIDADDTGTLFYLPVHRRTNLTSKGGMSNFGFLAQAVPLFLKGYDFVLEASKQSGPPGIAEIDRNLPTNSGKIGYTILTLIFRVNRAHNTG